MQLQLSCFLLLSSPKGICVCRYLFLLCRSPSQVGVIKLCTRDKAPAKWSHDHHCRILILHTPKAPRSAPHNSCISRKSVISTEAVHGLIVYSAVERPPHLSLLLPLSLPLPIFDSSFRTLIEGARIGFTLRMNIPTSNLPKPCQAPLSTKPASILHKRVAH
jgi:hypothetical protein